MDEQARVSDLGDQLFRITRRLRHASARATEPLGLSPHQVRALHVVGRADGARLSDIAERLRVAPRSATDVVDALEEKGLAVRSPDPKDRRALLVQLTDQGQEVLKHAIALRGRIHTTAFSVLTNVEREQLAALLAKVEAAAPQGPMQH